MCNNSGLGKSVHATSYFAENVAVGVYLVFESVFIDYILGKQFQLHSETFILAHWCYEIKIYEVDGHEFGVGSGDDAVQHQFDSQEIRGGGAAVVRIIDQVSSHSYSCSIWVFLFSPISAYDAAVCYVSPSLLWDFGFGEKYDSFGCHG